tara:strand:+ start:887 stop:1444 length:558 start_codon:yes stop_codon:yes gene_type:complete
MAAKQKPHYVNNKEFLAAMIEWNATFDLEKGDVVPPVTNYIAECFLKISTHLSYRPNFINYTYRDEMISDGIENCLQYVKNFDPEKSKNPFAYFTQIIYYAFLRRIQKEKKQTHVRNEMISKQDYQAFTTMDGDDTDYSVRGFDPNIMVPDEAVYKTKTNENAKKRGLENFMETDTDKVADRGMD